MFDQILGLGLAIPPFTSDLLKEGWRAERRQLFFQIAYITVVIDQSLIFF